MGSTVASFGTWLATDNPVAIGAALGLNVLAFELVTLAHELGHAAVVLARSEGLVSVRVGPSRLRWRGRFGRLKLELSPVPTLWRTAGEATFYARLGWGSRVMLALAGPTAGCLAAGSLILLGKRFEFLLLTIVGWVGIALELANLLPLRFRGTRTDGAYLLATLRMRRSGAGPDPLGDVATRWLVLVTDPPRAFDGRSRDVLSQVLVVLGRAQNDRSDEGWTLIRLAFGGWCWRRAERGDTTPIRDRVLDARHRAALRGMTRDDTIAAAATELVRKADLSSASPTPDSLERGFNEAIVGRRTNALAEEQERFAFCFGIALHDVVTIAG